MACICFTGDNAIVVTYGNSNCGLMSVTPISAASVASTSLVYESLGTRIECNMWETVLVDPIMVNQQKIDVAEQENVS